MYEYKYIIGMLQANHLIQAFHEILGLFLENHETMLFLLIIKENKIVLAIPKENILLHAFYKYS